MLWRTRSSTRLKKEEEDPVSSSVSLLETGSTHGELMCASVKNQIALGERRGRQVRFLGLRTFSQREAPQIKGPLCAYGGGFSLHAKVFVPAHRREDLSRLIGYVSRPSLSSKRMSETASGDIQYKLKRPWSDGRTHVVLSPLEFIEKLCALIPQPRMHLVRYSGVFAPNSKMRKGVIPGFTRAEIKAREKATIKDTERKLVCNHLWAKLLARVFAIDVSKCKYCGGDLKIISSLRDPFVIQKILSHLGLSPRPPPIAPQRTRKLFTTLS